MESREALCRVGKLLAQRGLVHYLLGTISVRHWKIPPSFLVKPATCLYETAEPTDFVEVGERGEPIDGSDRLPSLNFLVHLACYKARPDISAIVHAHPEKIVALISQEHPIFSGRPLRVPLLTQEAVWMVKHGGIPIVEDLDPKELAHQTARCIKEANVVAIRNHGIMAVGSTIWEALGGVLVAESEAAMITHTLSMGGTPLFRREETTEADLKCMPSNFSKKFN